VRNAKNSFRRLSMLVRDAYRLEPMEPRLLLSADPLVGVVQALLLPNPDLDHALLAAYDADGLAHLPGLADPSIPVGLTPRFVDAPVTEPTGASASDFAVDAATFDLARSAGRAGFLENSLGLGAQALRAMEPFEVAGFRSVDGSTAIVLGDALGMGSAASGARVIDPQALATMQDSLGRTVIGVDGSANPIYLSTAGNTGLNLDHSLVLYSNGVGGEVHMATDLTAPEITVYGSGHTTTISADSTANAGAYTLNDSARISGARAITAVGNIVIGTPTADLASGQKNFVGGDPATTTVADTLTLSTGGNLTFNGRVAAGQTEGEAGTTDLLNGITVTSAASVLFVQSVAMSGDLRIVSASGNVVFNQDVTLTGGGADLVIGAEAAGTPATVHDVTFGGQVTIDGNLVINASGTVTFLKAVKISAGGDLIVRGATLVSFPATSSVTLTGVASDSSKGEIWLQADEIELQITESLIQGQGLVTLLPTTSTLPIAIGLAPGLATIGVLDVDGAEMSAFADGFSAFVIGVNSGGHAASTAGALQLGSRSANPLFLDSATLYGGSITVVDAVDPTSTLSTASAATLKLDAYSNIEIRNETEAQELTLYSATGSVRQVDDNVDGLAAEATRALKLTVRGVTGVALGSVETNTVDVTNLTSGSLLVGINVARGSSLFASSVITGDVDVFRLAQGSTGSESLSLVSAGGSVTVLSAASPGFGVTTAGSGAVTLTAGGAGKDLLINQGISNAGPLTLSAGRAITTAANIDLLDSSASPVSLTATSGAITLGGHISSGSGISSGTSGGTVSLIAGAAITMTDGKHIVSLQAGSASLVAGGDIKLSQVEVGGSLVATTSGGAIVDWLTGDTPNLIGGSTSLGASTGIGTGAATGTSGALRTRITSLTVSDTTGGGLFVVEESALILNTVTLAGAAAGAGSMALTVTAGDLLVSGPVASTATTAGSGHLLLQAPAGSISVYANIGSISGSISLLAANALLVQGNSAVAVSAAGQTLDLSAGFAGVTMASTASLLTNNGAQRVETAGNVALGQLSAGTGAVSIRASGAASAITDAGGLVNVSAGSLRMEAGAGIGPAAASITTKVATLSAKSDAGGIFIAEADGVTVGTVAELTVKRVSAAGLAADSRFGTTALSGLSALSGGSIILSTGRTGAGAMVVDQAVQATGMGSILLSAPWSATATPITAAGAISLNAPVDAGSGWISLFAQGDIAQALAGKLLTSGGTIDVQAGGAVAMADGATANAPGNIRYVAAGAMTIGAIISSANVSLSASKLTDSGNTDIDVNAVALRIVTTGVANGDGAGTGTAPLQTTVARLAAMVAGTGTGGLFITETDALIVDQLDAISVQRVLGLRTLGAQLVSTSDPMLSDTVSSGNLVLQTLAGTLTVNEGDTDAGTLGVQAVGNVLLKAAGTGARLVINADLRTSGVAAAGAVAARGHVSLDAAGDIELNADVLTALGATSVDLVAGGRILMADALSSIATTDGNISLRASGNVTVETLTAGLGKVIVVAGAAGSIVDGDAAGDTEVDIMAAGLVLKAGNAIGVGGNAVETTVSTLTANAGAGGLFIAESDGVTVDTLTVNVQRVASNAAVAATSQAAQEDLVATGAGAVVLASATGAVVVNAGTAASAGDSG
jgi:hypothetical protein